MAFLLNVMNKLGQKVAEAGKTTQLQAFLASTDKRQTDAIRSLALGAGLGTEADLREIREHQAKFSAQAGKALAVTAIALPFIGKGLSGIAASAVKYAPTALKSTLQPTTISTGARPMGITDANGNFSFGAAAETLLQIALNRSIPDHGPIPQSAMMFPQVTQAGFPALPSFLGGAASAAGRIIGAGVGVVRSVAGRVTGFILANGRRVSVKDAASLAAQVGIVAAASTLGASPEEVAEAVLQSMKHRGRGRGITAAQLRTTRRTIGKLERAHKQIAKAARQHTR